MQLLLDNALPRQTPVFVATRRTPSNPWTYLPARLMTDQQHAEFTTSHLSEFAVLAMDVDGALQNFRDDVRAQLGGGVDHSVAKPICDRSDEARKDGYSVGFSRGKQTAFWCFGLANEARAITVVNRRTVPIQVTHAAAPAIEPVSIPKAWTAWAGVLGDQDTTFLAPGRSVTYDVDLEPRKRVLISATTDSNAQSLRGLHATVAAPGRGGEGLRRRHEQDGRHGQLAAGASPVRQGRSARAATRCWPAASRRRRSSRRSARAACSSRG